MIGMESIGQLKPQDIVVALKLVAIEGPRPSIATLANDLRLSASEVHGALRRLESCHLYDSGDRKVRSASLLEFLKHGIRYVFPAKPGEVSVGLPTAGSAAPLRDKIVHGPQEQIIWSYSEGGIRGQSIRPLYPTVPVAAAADPALHELLALVDALRVGRARERQLSAQELERRLA